MDFKNVSSEKILTHGERLYKEFGYKENLSSGVAADLLAVSIFLGMIEEITK